MVVNNMDVEFVKMNATKSGKCGEDLYFYLLGSDLYIEGTGELDMYFEEWYEEYDALPYSVEKVVIGHGCTVIGEGAFGRGAESIAQCWLYLTSIELPESVKIIKGGAFELCEELQHIHIPSSVEEIGSEAFAECSSLASIEIPAGVKKIGERVFLGCEKLTGIHVDPNNANYTSVDGVLFDKQMHTLVSFPDNRTGAYIIPDDVSVIGESAFFNTYLTGIKIPDSVVRIDRTAFDTYRYCRLKLSSVEIPDSVTDIGWGAFNGLKHIIYHGPAESKDNWGALSRN